MAFSKYHNLHKPKLLPSSPSQLLKVQMKCTRQHLIRSFPLLLLVVYVATIFLRLASPSSLVPPVDVPGKDLEKLKTHIIKSNQTPPQAHQEKPESPLSTCQALIDGKTNSKLDDGVGNSVLCCDRSHFRTDVCYMKGDVRTHRKSSSVLLYGPDGAGQGPEKIRPYTRKWETSIMETINEINLVQVGKSDNTTLASCDVTHNVPALLLSTGGYTGNVYHEFNDGLIPMYITTERFKGEVVLVVVEYHNWWQTRYVHLLKKFSNYEIVKFNRDKRIHCFPEMIVGMKIHGELSVDPQAMPTGKSIQDFNTLLHQAFSPPPTLPNIPHSNAPTIAIFVRTKSRVLLNLKHVIRRCKRIGYEVRLLNPKMNTPISDIHSVLSTSNVMLAVHGAAMTHFLFLSPRSTLIQIVPLGLDWAAEEYYGQPAKNMKLKYVNYKLQPEESSLLKEYGRNDPVIANPDEVTRKGWQETKRIYLEHQNVTVDVKRFGRVLSGVYSLVRRSNSRKVV